MSERIREKERESTGEETHQPMFRASDQTETERAREREERNVRDEREKDRFRCKVGA